MIRTLLAALAFASLGAAPAAAQSLQWEPYELPGGCQIMIVADAPLPPDLRLTWLGECAPGQPINGQADMRVEFTSPLADETDLAYGIASGTWVNGLPNGDFITRNYDARGQLMAEDRATYDMGCTVVEEEDHFNGCEPYTGQSTAPPIEDAEGEADE